MIKKVLVIYAALGLAACGDNSENTYTAATRLNGIDVSHFQGAVDWPKVKSADVHFTYIKASEGLHTGDARLQENWRGATKENLHAGVYHFFHPGEDAVAQAQHFIAQLEAANIDIKGALPPVLDAEIGEKVKPATFHKDVLTWLQTVEKALGCKPILYTAPHFWDQEDTSPIRHHSLWLADYAATPTLPKGWSQWTFWQHTQGGAVDGISGTVDLNYFAGNHEDIEKLKCR